MSVVEGPLIIFCGDLECPLGISGFGGELGLDIA